MLINLIYITQQDKVRLLLRGYFPIFRTLLKNNEKLLVYQCSRAHPISTPECRKSAFHLCMEVSPASKFKVYSLLDSLGTLTEVKTNLIKEHFSHRRRHRIPKSTTSSKKLHNAGEKVRGHI